MSGVILFLKEFRHVYCLSTVRASLRSLCIICSLILKGHVILSKDKYVKDKCMCSQDK